MNNETNGIKLINLSLVAIMAQDNKSRNGEIPPVSSELVGLMARGWQEGQYGRARVLTLDEQREALELLIKEHESLKELKAKWALEVHTLDSLESDPVTISKEQYIAEWESLHMSGPNEYIQPIYGLIACFRRFSSIPLVNAVLHNRQGADSVIKELPVRVKDYLSLADGDEQAARLAWVLDNIEENNLKIGAVEPSTVQHLSAGITLLKDGYKQQSLITVFGQKWLAQLIAAVFNASEFKTFRSLKIGDGYCSKKYDLKGVKSEHLRAAIGNTRPKKGEEKIASWALDTMTKYLANPTDTIKTLAGEKSETKPEPFKKESIAQTSAMSDSFLVKDTLAALEQGDKEVIKSLNVYAFPLNLLYETIETVPSPESALALALLAQFEGDIKQATKALKDAASILSVETE